MGHQLPPPPPNPILSKGKPTYTQKHTNLDDGDITVKVIILYFDVELRLSPRWAGGNIGSTDATKTCHNLNAYIFEINIRKVINNTSLASL
jgi:hypothetical protein